MCPLGSLGKRQRQAAKILGGHERRDGQCGDTVAIAFRTFSAFSASTLPSSIVAGVRLERDAVEARNDVDVEMEDRLAGRGPR